MNNWEISVAGIDIGNARTNIWNDPDPHCKLPSNESDINGNDNNDNKVNVLPLPLASAPSMSFISDTKHHVNKDITNSTRSLLPIHKSAKAHGDNVGHVIPTPSKLVNNNNSDGNFVSKNNNCMPLYEERTGFRRVGAKPKLRPNVAPSFLSMVRTKLEEEKLKSERPKLRKRITEHDQLLYALVMKETIREYEQKAPNPKDRIMIEGSKKTVPHCDKSPDFLDIMERKIAEKAAEVIPSLNNVSSRDNNSTDKEETIVIESPYANAILETLKEYEQLKTEQHLTKKVAETFGYAFEKRPCSGNSPNFLSLLEKKLIENKLIDHDVTNDDDLSGEESISALIVKGAVLENRNRNDSAHKHADMLDERKRTHSSSSDISVTSKEVQQINQCCSSKSVSCMVPTDEHKIISSENKPQKFHPHHIDRPFWNDSTDVAVTSSSYHIFHNDIALKGNRKSSLHDNGFSQNLVNISSVGKVEVVDTFASVDNKDTVKESRSAKSLKEVPIEKTVNNLFPIPPGDNILTNDHKSKNEIVDINNNLNDSPKINGKKKDYNIDDDSFRNCYLSPTLQPRVEFDDENKLPTKIGSESTQNYVSNPPLINRSVKPMSKMENEYNSGKEISDCIPEKYFPNLVDRSVEHAMVIPHKDRVTDQSMIPPPDYSPLSSPVVEKKALLTTKPDPKARNIFCIEWPALPTEIDTVLPNDTSSSSCFTSKNKHDCTYMVNRCNNKTFDSLVTRTTNVRNTLFSQYNSIPSAFIAADADKSCDIRRKEKLLNTPIQSSTVPIERNVIEVLKEVYIQPPKRIVPIDHPLHGTIHNTVAEDILLKKGLNNQMTSNDISKKDTSPKSHHFTYIDGKPGQQDTIEDNLNTPPPIPDRSRKPLKKDRAY